MKQKYNSANTSVNSKRVPALFRRINWYPGMINFDNGGGKFDTATWHLHILGVKNLVYDPFNRSEEHNNAVLKCVAGKPVHSSTLANVLNVIAEPKVRLGILRRSYDALDHCGVLYVWIYEGDKSGVGRETKRGCWQENRRTKSYTEEILKVFDEVIDIDGNMITAYKA